MQKSSLVGYLDRGEGGRGMIMGWDGEKLTAGGTGELSEDGQHVRRR
jgi:hypothetical protein